MDINFKNDAFALVGIKSTNPEIVGTDSMDLNIEIPMGKTVKVSLKLTSTVASSVVAQKELNQIARDNIVSSAQDSRRNTLPHGQRLLLVPKET